MLSLNLLMQDLPKWGRAWCALRKAPDSAVSCAVISASGGDSARSASALQKHSPRI